MPSGRNGSTAPSDDHATASRTLRRRRVLAGVGAGIAAGAAGAAAGASGAEPVGQRLDPATVWRSSPTDDEVVALTAGESVVAARTRAAFVGLDPGSGDRRWRQTSASSGAQLFTHRGRTYLNEGGTLVARGRDGSVGWSFDPEPDEQATLDVGFRGERCYVSVNLPGDRRLLSLSAAEGQREWTVEGPDTSLIHVTDDVVVALTEPLGYDVSERDLVGYDRADGSELWRYELGDVDRYTYSASGDTVYLRYGGEQYAVAAADGTVRWSKSAEEVPGLFARVGETTYAITRGELLGLTEDGSVRWSLESEGFSVPIGPVDGGLAVLSGTEVYVIDRDGTRRWRYEFQGGQETRNGRVVDGTVFVADGGALYRIEGGERTWSFAPDGGSPTTLAVGGGRLYAADRETVYAVDPDGDGGETGTTTRPGTTAAGGATTGAPASTTAGAGTGTGGDDSGGTTTATTAPVDTADETTGPGDGTTTESGSGGSPGFGVVGVLATGLLAAARLLGSDDED
jgi:hypothetical protein